MCFHRDNATFHRIFTSIETFVVRRDRSVRRRMADKSSSYRTVYEMQFETEFDENRERKSNQVRLKMGSESFSERESEI